MKIHRTYFVLLGVLQLVIATGALAGGLTLITDPSGQITGLSVELLKRSPFPDFSVPGMFLFLVHGLGNAVGSILSFFRSNAAGKTGLSLGIILLLWLVAQVYWIGLNHFLQPLFFGIGIVEIFLSFIVMRFSDTTLHSL